MEVGFEIDDRRLQGKGEVITTTEKICTREAKGIAGRDKRLWSGGLELALQLLGAGGIFSWVAARHSPASASYRLPDCSASSIWPFHCSGQRTNLHLPSVIPHLPSHAFLVSPRDTRDPKMPCWLELVLSLVWSPHLP